MTWFLAHSLHHRQIRVVSSADFRTGRSTVDFAKVLAPALADSWSAVCGKTSQAGKQSEGATWMQSLSVMTFLCFLCLCHVCDCVPVYQHVKLLKRQTYTQASSLLAAVFHLK